MTSYPSPRTYPRRSTPAEPSGSGVLVKVVAVFLGIAVAVLSVVAVVLVQTADEARDDVQASAATTDHSSHTSGSSAVSLPLQSFAGKTGADAEALAQAHTAYDAVLPAVPAGDLVKVHMVLKDMVVEIAPGVKYNTWAFDGHGAPGPIVHVHSPSPWLLLFLGGNSIRRAFRGSME